MKPGAVDNKKTLALARLIQEGSCPTSPAAQAAGHLAALWAWAWGRTDDGDLSLFDAHDIASAAKWRGDAQAFVEMLVEVGYLDRHGARLVLHDAEEHRPDYVRKRITERAKRRGNRPRTTIPECVPERIPECVAEHTPEQVGHAFRKKSRSSSPPSASALALASDLAPGDRIGGDRVHVAREARPLALENPHPPEEPRPSETRALLDVGSEVLRVWVARWSRVHETQPAWPQASRERLERFLAARVASLGSARVLAALDELLTRTHPSVASHSPEVVMREFDSADMAARAALRPPAPKDSARRALGRGAYQPKQCSVCGCSETAHDFASSQTFSPCTSCGECDDFAGGAAAGAAR